MRKLAALLVGAALMMASASAWAIPVTLTESQLLTATQVASNSADAPILGVYDLPNILYPTIGGVGFEATLSLMNISTTITGPASSTIAVNASNYGLSDLSAYDTFQLMIANYNQSLWNLNLYIEANDGDKYYSAVKTLSHDGVFNNFSYDLSFLGTDINSVKYLGFVVSSDLTGNFSNPDFPSSPDSFHVAVAPVPEPGTMMLLGLGIFGLAIFGKRRMNKNA